LWWWWWWIDHGAAEYSVQVYKFNESAEIKDGDERFI
jgi:hypothetical protein